MQSKALIDVPWSGATESSLVLKPYTTYSKLSSSIFTCWPLMKILQMRCECSSSSSSSRGIKFLPRQTDLLKDAIAHVGQICYEDRLRSEHSDSGKRPLLTILTTLWSTLRKNHGGGHGPAIYRRECSEDAP